MEKNKNTNPIIIILGIVFIILLVYFFARYILPDFEDESELRFCNGQGWAYTSGYNGDSKTIWCGARSGNGFTGITYPVYKNWIGNYKVEKDFDVNLYLSKERYASSCEDECRLEHSAPMYDTDYENELCLCFNMEDFDNPIIINLSKEDN